MSIDRKKTIVVTGIGTINPLGNDIKTTWNKILKGISGIERITTFDPDHYGLGSKVAGEVKNFEPMSFYPDGVKSKAKRFDPFIHYAQAATLQALDQSRLNIANESERIGIAIGSGIGGMHVNRNQAGIFFNKGAKRISPFYIPSFIGNMAAGFLSIIHNIKGPNVSLQTACATGNHSIIMAKMIIESEMADVMITGATEGIIEPLSMAGFDSMRALSRNFNDHPQVSSRPYDKERDGFVMGEGAGILVLESLEHAQSRGANIICELVGSGMSGDAYDIVMPCSDGDGAYRAMKNAIDDAKISSKDVRYINAHGTSTPLGDIAEAKAIKRLMGENSKNYYVGSTKSMSGHLIGAASAFEAIISILSLTHNIIPPNINIFDFDETTELNLEVINTQPIETELNYVMSNSFGFGGHNSSVIFKKYS